MYTTERNGGGERACESIGLWEEDPQKKLSTPSPCTRWFYELGFKAWNCTKEVN